MTEIRVRYPAGPPLTLRTSLDWNLDVPPTTVTREGSERVFHVDADASEPVYFKPVRRTGESLDWAVGEDYLLAPGEPRTVYPHFDGGTRGRITDHITLGERTARVFLPPGYDDNVLKQYPVLFVLDGANVFFPEEAFSGTDWALDETLICLDAMNLVDKVLVVALYSVPERRSDEYTAPGYVAFGEELVDVVLPEVRSRFRTLVGAEHTAIMGSSLGGVAALHVALRHADTVGMAACLSSTFGYRDDLLQRLGTQPVPRVRVYLDAGLPADNHRPTRVIFDALIARGLRPGSDVLFLGFPGALHHERAWAQRVHLPIQFFFGRSFRRA
ncbi:MAG: hypothetical protein H6734_18880 [Alphaproteobacteria bacterium]|nr:hypothetical protein [Alphaproteobacteria bacterium]